VGNGELFAEIGSCKKVFTRGWFKSPLFLPLNPQGGLLIYIGLKAPLWGMGVNKT
jgi:hypothetical protein